jgi:circadian clock protein KaiC
LNQDRLSTGIEGFDKLVEGGIPRGSLVILAGEPGTGKTIFGSQYLYYGISKLDEPGVYASLAENRESFMVNMKRIKMDFEKYEAKGKFRFMDLVTVKEQGVEPVLQSILAEVTALKAKRLLVDSFTALAQAFSELIDARIVLHVILGKIVRQMGVTTLLISEKPKGSESSTGGIEEYVADGVIALTFSSERGGYLSRKLQVTKMRGTNQSRAQLRYDIGKYGVRVFPEVKLKVVEKLPTGRMNTGIEGLDKMLYGGVPKGSVTLIAGASGTGKTTAALHFIVGGAMQNEKGLFVSFEEPVQQLIRHGEGFNWNINEFIKKGLVSIVSYYPENYNFEELLLMFMNLLQQYRPVRLVVDSLLPLERVLSNDEYIQFIKNVESHAKADGITSMFTTAGLPASPMTERGISALVDNTISLRDIELESALRRSLVIFKARGIAHDRDIREFEITSRGMAVKEKFAGVEQILQGVAKKTMSEEAAKAWVKTFGDLVESQQHTQT